MGVWRSLQWMTVPRMTAPQFAEGLRRQTGEFGCCGRRTAVFPRPEILGSMLPQGNMSFFWTATMRFIRACWRKCFGRRRRTMHSWFSAGTGNWTVTAWGRFWRQHPAVQGKRSGRQYPAVQGKRSGRRYTAVQGKRGGRQYPAVQGKRSGRRYPAAKRKHSGGQHTVLWRNLLYRKREGDENQIARKFRKEPDGRGAWQRTRPERKSGFM